MTDASRASGDFPDVSAAEAVELVRSGAYLLDVREQSEWDAGHAPQAVLVPLSELAERLDEVPTDRDVLVVCHAGMRSMRASAALRRAGHRAVNVEGGMLAWRDAQGELTSDSGAEPSVD
ncbi:rhodanese-related sulfurtransferase [Frigoribacterium sp. PhB160]|uniref:rhodanese-like domain-containing protein n=1 Tax=Frigoribacterium sp. PhB160 TaxID=2485192 RepID=UPI000F46A07C|nr:rhodanese-like domain-containing protein [Frigoribacterium sp. PhB160]ROS62323.1 rhodanese-related sulfurtransferase [Frigoribacterium sp. PhB160]